MKVLDHDGTDHLIDKIYDAINSGGSADYIMEEGTSGIWTYRKWASGIAECWGNQTITLSGTGDLWKTPLYGYTNIPRLSYPFTFFQTPDEVVSAKGGVNAFWLYKQAGGDNSTTQAGLYALIKVDPFTSGSTAVISYQAKGLWKEFTPSISAKAQVGYEDFTSQVTVNNTYFNVVDGSARRVGNIGFLRYRLTTKSAVSSAMSVPILTLPHNGIKLVDMIYFGSADATRPLMNLGNNQVFEGWSSSLGSGVIIEFFIVYIIMD